MGKLGVLIGDLGGRTVQKEREREGINNMKKAIRIILFYMYLKLNMILKCTYIQIHMYSICRYIYTYG